MIPDGGGAKRELNGAVDRGRLAEWRCESPRASLVPDAGLHNGLSQNVARRGRGKRVGETNQRGVPQSPVERQA
jgi:hypothetical protein